MSLEPVPPGDGTDTRRLSRMRVCAVRARCRVPRKIIGRNRWLGDECQSLLSATRLPCFLLIHHLD